MKRGVAKFVQGASVLVSCGAEFDIEQTACQEEVPRLAPLGRVWEMVALRLERLVTNDRSQDCLGGKDQAEDDEGVSPGGGAGQGSVRKTYVSGAQAKRCGRA